MVLASAGAWSAGTRDTAAESGLSAAAPADRISAARTLAQENASGSAGTVQTALHGEKDAKAKAVLVGTLGLLKTDAAVLSDLEGALKDKDAGVRLEAVGALGRIPSAQALGDLVSELKRDPDANVRQMAALRLTGAKDDSAVAALAEALSKDPNPGVRQQAAFALGGAAQKEAKDALERAKTDHDANVQKAAKAVARP